MTNKLHEQVIELLLSSMFQGRADRHNHQFLFGKPGALQWEKNLGAEIYVDRLKLNLAALHVRQNGPKYLKSLSLSDVSSKLSNFMVANYYTISHGNCFTSFPESYNERVSGAARLEFTRALAESDIFKTKSHWSAFPLLAIIVEADFHGRNFCILRPSSLAGDKFFTATEATHITPDYFPPLTDFSGRKQIPSAWLCVRSPDVQASEKIARVISGAFALAILHSYRYTFSGRAMFGGVCTFNEGASYSFTDKNLIPPLMNDMSLTSDDDWLTIIDDKLESNHKTDNRHLKSLEYFYRAWSLESPERFPVLCMTLDAIFGDASQATQSVINKVRATLGNHIDEERVRLLLKLRASVIHGGAPDVYESSKYVKYIRSYEADPIVDLERLTQECLRKVVFDGKQREQDNPHARLIAQKKSEGTYKEPQHGNYII